jgi:dTDP-glucose 4,6-dehydratase
MKETVLLTGYAGFIGSQLLRDLIKEGYDVVGIDNFSEGSSDENFEDFVDDFLPLQFDISDSLLSQHLKEYKINKIDYIINCAAQSHVDRSFAQVRKFIDSNIKGPLNLANLALDPEWGVKRFLQVSTDEVFSDSPQPFHEETRHTPQNAYSTSKSSAEMFLRNYQRAFNLPLIITNGANTYGERQLEEKIIPLTIKRIMSGQKVPLYKTPAQRMWLHVEDHSSGIINALQFGVIGENYCLAPEPENELYTEQLVLSICKLLDKNFHDVVDIVEDRPNYDLRYFMLNEKATHKIGWLPGKHISEELPKIVEYYKRKFSHE